MKNLILAGAFTLLSVVSAVAQVEVAKGDTLGASQSTRLRIGANGSGRPGFKASTGNFSAFATLQELGSATAGGISSVNGKTGTSITLTTNDVGENVRLYYTDARARAALSATGPITYNSTTGAFTWTGTKADVGLSLVANALQVINAGGMVSEGAGTFSARPTAGTLGRKYYATDNFTEYYDNGTAWQVIQPAITGDVTVAAGGTVATLPTVNANVGTFGANNAVAIPTVNGKGLVTGMTTAQITPAGIGAADATAVVPFSSVTAYSSLSGVTAPATGFLKFVRVANDERYTEVNSLYIIDAGGKIVKIVTNKEN